MSNFYRKIKTLCDEKGITGYRLCQMVGMSPGILTDLKMGRQKSLNPQRASEVAQVLNVPIEFLFETGVFANWADIEDDLFGVFKALPEECIEVLDLLYDIDPQDPTQAKLSEIVSFLNAAACSVHKDSELGWVITPRPANRPAEAKKENAPASEDAKAVNVDYSKVYQMLVDLGYIEPGQDLTDADTRFLLSTGELIRSWFANGK